ncbi:related to RCY1 - F-box protein involved in recycling plasma membrane proteins [Ustilago trichophora]|uniref:Related to RCY1 - F-box protein involved in recycling plasma membrane proteins n=1 Tax=Ustilago trichophora TaxID=86804 RepID=A0A5C3EBE6_9BASI|nr:related to RCY1 - F-box protein involved in recycling plasma membrane proteins [Ustilago trichophora]
METTWTPLVPTTKPSTSSGLASVINGRQSGSGEATAPVAAAASSSVNDVSLDPFSIGTFPSTVIQRILSFVPVSDLRSCALAARSLARFVADERLWAQKLSALQYKQIPGHHIRYNPDLSTLSTTASRSVQNDTQLPSRNNSFSSSKVQPITTATTNNNNTNASPVFDSNDDEFGDFEAATITSPDDESFGGFVSSKPSQSGQSFSSAPVFSYRAESKLPVPSTEPDSAYQTFKRIAVTLKPFVQSLLFETSPSTSLVFTDPSLSSLSSQAHMICNIARFTGPLVLGSFAKPENPTQSASQAADASSDPFDQDQWRLHMSIREAADYLEGVLLSAFEGADARRADALRAGQRGMDVSKAVERAEADMHEHATLVWNLAVSTAESSTSSSATNSALGMLPEGENTNFLSLLDHPGSAAALSFLEKRDTLFKTTLHRPEANFTTSTTQSRPTLDFTAMDAFMAHVLASLETDGSLVARVFPPEQQVLLAFATRIANEVVGEYINGILNKARSIDIHLYLQAAAATFSQALKISDTLNMIEPRHPAFVDPAKCRAIVLSMFEAHLDEYLQEERDWVRNVMMDMCNDGDSDAASTRKSASVKQSKTMDTAFLASNNPAQVKRNVLSGFKDVLLMPVTVVPRAAGAVGGAVIRTAGTGLSQLNPLKWQQGSAGGARNASGTSSVLGGTPQRSSTPAMASQSDVATNNGYVDFSKQVLGGPEGHVIGDDDSDEEELDASLSTNEKTDGFGGFANSSVANEWNEKSSSHDVSANTWTNSSVATSVDAGGWNASVNTNTNGFTNETSELDEKRLAAAQSTEQSGSRRVAEPKPRTDPSRFAQLQLLLSLDTALSLIQVNRESLKRMEAFMVYPPTTSNGRRVIDEMEEVCLSLFQVLGDQHIAPGFTKATEEIKQWNPLSDGQSSSSSSSSSSSDAGGGGAEVLPLVQFFELTHIADTISQLCSVYFSQTLVSVVKLDVEDFLNPVVRAKKAFEGNLDEFVAGGLSVSVDLLMKRAEWILFSQRDPLDYAGDDVGSMGELDSSTKATRMTIEMLGFHCRLVVGVTDREILEVFYTEVGVRLFGILTKHLKSLKISQSGAFKLISDLNHFSTFINSLKSKNQEITILFNSLKSLANYYIVDGKQLISLLKNSSSSSKYPPASSSSATTTTQQDQFIFGQEELYEFLKSRSDFRQIEKQIDHEIFGFKLSEDCIVS